MTSALILSLLLIVIISVEARSYSKRSNEDSLELVHVLFRHGDRTPDKHLIYPNDPHKNETYFPVGYGQLTNAGKRKEYLLGKALRKRYGKFLGDYNIDTIDARCTDYNRTKMSLQLVLASLFPPENDLVWEKRLRWQPIPFNYWDIKDDHVLGDPYKNCLRYNKSQQDYLLSSEGEQLYENYTDKLDYITQHAGFSKSAKYYTDLYFTLTTEQENGLLLPNWTESIYPDTVRDLAIAEYLVSTGTVQLKRIASGFLVKKIVSDTRDKIRKTLQSQNTKMYLYSGHEFNLAYLLRFLGVFYPHIPPYGSYISIEIHNVNNIRGVKVFYQDYHTEKLRRLRIPNCEGFCRFEHFVSLYQQYLPDEDECLM